MSEGGSKKKSSSSAGGAGGAQAGGGQKKKQRPPPLEVEPNNVSSGPGSMGNFQLPTMRSMFVPNQQIMVTPAHQIWDIQEQTQLERLHRVMCFPNESLLNKSIKIAAHLNAKTVRDVACRLKSMEESTAPLQRPLDDVDKFLLRGEAIINELQSIPPRDRTDEQAGKLTRLMHEFVNGTRECRSKLDGRQLKIPVQYVPVPELPDSLKHSNQTSTSAGDNGIKSSGK